MKALAVVCAVGIGLPGVAHASPLADALARAKVSDVEALRAQRTDPVARCTLGAVYAKRGDLTRAALYLADCEARELPDDVGLEIRKHARETRKRLEASELAMIELASRPEGMAVETDALAGEPLVTPVRIWVKAGTYEVRGSHDGRLYKVTVVAAPRARAVAYLDAGAVRKAAPPPDRTVDFSEEGGETQQVAPPPDVKRPSLVPDRYRGTLVGGVPQLDDPLAVRAVRRTRARPWSIGARLGGGVFDAADADAAAGLAAAATGRYRLGAAFVDARFGWSHDTLAGALGGGFAAGALAVLLHVRGDRASVGAALGIELAIPATPVVVGARYEQGASSLAARAGVLELGLDWPFR